MSPSSTPRRLAPDEGRDRRGPAGKLALWTLVWVVAALVVAAVLFLNGSRSTVIAGHDAEVAPTLDGHATLDLGPYLPRFRVATGDLLGADVDLGATEVDSYQALIARYAVLASQPESQIDKLRSTVTDLARDSLLLGALAALAVPAVALLVGRRRWAELVRRRTRRRTVLSACVVALAALAAAAAVWGGTEDRVRTDTWQSISEALPGIGVPAEVAGVEVESGLFTSGTRRLAESALDTYRRSQTFYDELVEAAPALSEELRQPLESEVVGLLVSDRHDNIGMDPVARAVADAGGATFLLDAGDDTSTGSSWEAFSLESLDQAFGDVEDRYSVAGNHDNGDFVTETFDRLGFTTLTGDVVEGPAGIRLLGASDVRSSGLGSWRDENGEVTFAEQRTLLADRACESDEAGERIATLLVHDANSGREALERGCVDLVLAGHLHAQVGPDPVVGDNSAVGYSYTNGTTGGAAYALALGSKLRRDAEVTLVTYSGGRPVGLQPVVVRTIGEFRVGAWIPLDLTTD